MRGSGPAVVGVGLVLPGTALAHAPFAGAGDFYGGVLHPLSGLDFAVPLLALGLLAGQQPGERGYLAAFACAFAGALGAGVAPHLPAIAWSGHAAAACTALAGGLVAAAREPPAWLLFGLTTALGLSLGLMHGAELRPTMRAGPFALGFAVAAGLVVVYGCAIVRRLRPPVARQGVRVAGSWLAAVGALTLGLALRG